MLVTVDDLADYMDIKFSNRQRRAAEMILEGLQSELEEYLRRPIEPTEFSEEYVISSEWMGLPHDSYLYDYSLDSTQQYSGYFSPPVMLYLRQSPVVEVTSLYIVNPTTSASTTCEFGADYVVRRYGLELHRGYPSDRVTITYTAGLDGAEIKIFKGLILRAATREAQNMHDDTVGVKDLETRNVAPLITGFTEAELKSVKRRKRNRVA